VRARAPRPGRRPRALFGKRVWPGVAARLARTGVRLLLAFDLDGTLAPIVRDPARARVPIPTLRLLRRAVRLPRVTLAVLTARRAREARRLVPVRGMKVAAQYGLEGPEPLGPALRRRWRRAASRIAPALRAIAAASPGAWVEHKGMTVAIHDRGVAPGRLRGLRRSVDRVAREALRLGFQAVPGRRVTEFMPRGRNKGRALTALRRRARADEVFYFGDSGADEPAFASLGPDDVSVRVGPGRTGARYRIRDPRGVSRFLRALLSLRTP